MYRHQHMWFSEDKTFHFGAEYKKMYRKPGESYTGVNVYHFVLAVLDENL